MNVKASFESPAQQVRVIIPCRKLFVSSNYDSSSFFVSSQSMGSYLDDILCEIFSYFDYLALGNSARGCKRWSKLTEEGPYWKSLYLRKCKEETQSTIAGNWKQKYKVSD